MQRPGREVAYRALHDFGVERGGGRFTEIPHLLRVQFRQVRGGKMHYDRLPGLGKDAELPCNRGVRSVSPRIDDCDAIRGKRVLAWPELALFESNYGADSGSPKA